MISWIFKFYNGYFYYSTNKNIILKVSVDKYNNGGNYKDSPKDAFSTGKLNFGIFYLNNNKIYSDWQSLNPSNNLINRVEYEWYAKFRSTLDNRIYNNSWIFNKNRSWGYIRDWIKDQPIKWLRQELWETYDVKFIDFNGRDFIYEFGIEKKNMTKHGLRYVLKLGSADDKVGDLPTISKGIVKFWDANFSQTLKDKKFKKIDLKFRLYRANDEKSANEDSLLPIDPLKTYTISHD